MTTYATADQLAQYLGSAHTPPDDDETARLLERASQLIDTNTRGRAQAAYDGDLSAGTLVGELPVGALTQAEYQAALARATCAQVEFWLEVGEEHDIVGLTGSAMTGRVRFSRLPKRLGVRAYDALVGAGLISARVWIR